MGRRSIYSLGKQPVSVNKTSIHFIRMMIFIAFSVPFSLFSQDANFSQYYAAPLYLNPALAGVNQNISIGLNYRSQLKSDLYPNQSSQFSLIIPIIGKGDTNAHKGGIGVSAYNEVAGQFSNFKVMGANITGAYNLYLKSDGSQKITFAIQGGFLNKSIDFNNLTWGSQFDPFVGFDTSINPGISIVSENTMYPIFNAAMMWYAALGGDDGKNSAAYLGFTMGNINEPNESLLDGEIIKLPRLFKANGGLDLSISEKITLSPNVLVKYQNKNFQFNAGTYLYYDLVAPDEENGAKNAQLILGTWYRYGDSFIAAAGISKSNLTVGFSYDMRVSTLRHPDIGSGAYEISLTYKFKRKVKEKTYEHKPRFAI